MFQGSVRGSLRAFQSVSKKLKGCLRIILRVFQGCSKGASRGFMEISKVFLGFTTFFKVKVFGFCTVNYKKVTSCYKEVLRIF